MVSAYMPLIFVAPLGQGAGVGLDLLPLALLANGIGAVTGVQVGGRVADRLGAANAVRVASLAQVALLLAFAGCVLLPGTAAAPLFIVLIGLSASSAGVSGLRSRASSPGCRLLRRRWPSR